MYRNPKTDKEIVVITFGKTPPKKRTFRDSGGNRRFEAVSATSQYKELVFVAKTKDKKAKGSKKGKKDEELDELEELEDLEDLEEEEDDEEEDGDDEESDDDEDDEDSDDEDDEDEEDDEEDEEEEDDDEEDDEDEDEPAPKKKSKSKAKASKSKKADGRVGTAELAEAAGCDARTLRIFLRKHKDKFPKDEDTGRYEWPSLNNKDAKKIISMIQKGGAKEAKQEGLDKLKASKKKGKKGKDTQKAKAGKKGGKKKSSKK